DQPRHALVEIAKLRKDGLDWSALTWLEGRALETLGLTAAARLRYERYLEGPRSEDLAKRAQAALKSD
ncbi:MAG: hypothetical protein KDB53_00610, partial [Planctomycetes bacterium]|nr:hypothetical protein [Planctomycetota bacterium]